MTQQFGRYGFVCVLAMLFVVVTFSLGYGQCEFGCDDVVFCYQEFDPNMKKLCFKYDPHPSCPQKNIWTPDIPSGDCTILNPVVYTAHYQCGTCTPECGNLPSRAGKTCQKCVQLSPAVPIYICKKDQS